jgi:hypothetical protein
MYFKKYFILVIFLLTTTQAIAKEYNKIGLNFFYNVGIPINKNFPFHNIELETPDDFLTLNGQLGALYELNKSSTGSLVIGAGYVYNASYYDGGVKFLGTSYSKNLLSTSIGGKVYIGYKLIPRDRFSMYALGHLGYYFYNKNNILSEETKIENHIHYGASLMNTFNLTNNFGINLSLEVNSNSMNIKDENLNINEKSNYTDIIISLGLAYSI